MSNTAQIEAAEETQRQQEEAIQDARAAIDSIATTVSGRADSLFVVFLHENVDDKSLGIIGKLPGMAAGVALGGPVGEMIFGGTLLSDNCKYKGDLKVLILTEKRISIGIFNDTPFPSLDGSIYAEHLQLLHARADSGAFVMERYDFPSSDVTGPGTMAKIRGRDVEQFQKAELYINHVLYPTPDLREIAKHINRSAGSLALPYQFLNKLDAGENETVKLLSRKHILSDGQADAAVGNSAYVAELVELLSEYSTRDSLLQRIPALQPPLRAAIEAQLRSKGATCSRSIGWLLFWMLLAMGSMVAPIALLVINPPQDIPDMAWVIWCVIALLISGIGAKVCWGDFKKTDWCRKAAAKLQTKATE